MRVRFTYYRDEACLLDSAGEPHAISNTYFSFLTSVARSKRLARKESTWIGVLEFDELPTADIEGFLVAPLADELRQELESLLPPE